MNLAINSMMLISVDNAEKTYSDFDIDNIEVIDGINKAISHAAQFTVAKNFSPYSTDETLCRAYCVTYNNDEKSGQPLFQVNIHFNSLESSVTEFEKTIEDSYMDIVAYFDKFGFNITDTSCQYKIFDQTGISNDELDKIKEEMKYHKIDNIQKTIEYIDYLASSDCIVVTDEQALEAWDNLIKNGYE